MVVSKGSFSDGWGSGGPTAFDLGTYTYDGPTIDGADLQITFGTCCLPGPPHLETNLPTGGNTPEPSTLLLMAGGLGLIGFARRYRLRQSK